MPYAPEDVEKLYEGRQDASEKLQKLVVRLLTEVADEVSSDDARQYVVHGLCRRLRTLARCLQNAFEIHPPERDSLLDTDERLDLQINLHAFLVNVFGALDNIAWVFVLHHGLLESVGGKMNVGLFKGKTTRHFSGALRSVTSSEALRRWHDDYAKNYRDAVAHRIPLYVPHSFVNTEDAGRYAELSREVNDALESGDLEAVAVAERDRDALEQPSLWFAQAFGDRDASPARFHEQLVCDALTVLEFAEALLASFRERASVN